MQSCNDVLSCIAIYVPSLFEAAFMVIAAASAFTALTPTPADDQLVARIYKLVEVMALNIGYAKDKPAAGGRFVPK